MITLKTRACLSRFLPYMFAIDRVILANMRDFAKRGRKADTVRFMKSVAWLAVLFVITILAVRGAWGMYGKFAEAAQSDELAHKELADLKEQQAQVNASVDSFTNDRGLEAQVRERYGVVKPGEGQIQIVRDSSTTTIQASRGKN